MLEDKQERNLYIVGIVDDREPVTDTVLAQGDLDQHLDVCLVDPLNVKQSANLSERVINRWRPPPGNKKTRSCSAAWGT